MAKTKEASHQLDLEDQKEQMFEKLIERGISQPTLDAMRQVPRELFVPDDKKHLVYDLESILFGAENPSIVSAPQVVADMIDMLDVSPKDHVFELGTATGYQAAVLSHLVNKVTTAEIDEELASTAISNFDELGLRNIEVITQDGTSWFQKTDQRFSRLIVSASIPPMPESGIFELLEDGGICVVPIGGEFGDEEMCRLTKIVKQNQALTIVKFVPNYFFVPLQGKYDWKTYYTSLTFFEYPKFFQENEQSYFDVYKKAIARKKKSMGLENKEFVSNVEEE